MTKNSTYSFNIRIASFPLKWIIEIGMLTKVHVRHIGHGKMRVMGKNVCITRFDSLVPVKFEINFRYAFFKRILVIDSWSISCEIALI